LVEKIDQNDFYDAAPLEPHLVYQGEVLVDVPILYMSKISRWLLVRTGKGGSVMEALQNGQTPGTVKVWDSNKTDILWNEHQEGDYALGQLSKAPVLVLSQTCDIQTKQSIQVAPILPAPDDGSYVGRLERHEIFSAFPIAPHPPEIENFRFADFEQIQSVHKSYIKRLKPEHHFRLSPANVRLLQRSITRYYGRPNSFDAESDRVPRSGTYLCTSCFYMKGVVSEAILEEKSPFPPCAKCHGGQWVLRGT
jgi:hypothetical protein